MKSWDRLDGIVSRVEKALMVAFLSLMILTAFAQIVLRNFWGVGLAWSEPLVRYLVLWVGFIGAALATREGRHITLEVLARRTPGRGSRVPEALSQLCSGLVCALLAYAAMKFIHDEAQIGSRTFLDLPIWIPELIIPITFAVMALRFLLRTIRALRGPAGVQPGPHPL